MATTTSQTSREEGRFNIDVRQHGYPCGPTNVRVEVSPAGQGVFMAILAAGAAGRYSFDFRVKRGGIKIKRAYVEGMREPVGKLPGWVEPIRERIEEEMDL